MKIKIFKLIKMLKFIYGGIKKKKENNLSMYVLIKNIDEKVFCIAINEEIEIVSYDINESFNSNLNFLIRYDLIYNICKNHDENLLIDINKTKNSINIFIENSFFCLPIVDTQIFPAFNHEKNIKIKFKIKTSDFLNLLNISLLTTAENNPKLFLNGILMDINKNVMYILSSDGIRISFLYIFLNENYKQNKFIIPKNTICELVDNFNNDEFVTILISENQIKFINKKNTMTSRIINDIYIYPNLNLISIDKVTYFFDLKIFKNSLNKISIFCINNNKINLSIEKNKIYFNVNNNHEIANTYFIHNHEKTEININMDYKFLLDITKLIQNKNFELTVPFTNKFVIIKENNLNYIYIVPQLN